MLHVNLDETHVQLVPGRQRGNAVCVSTRRARRRAPTRNVSLSDRRAGFTHVALVCDDPAVQAVLPQLLLVPARQMTLAVWREADQRSPRNVYVLRTKNGWNSTRMLARHVRLLAKILESAAPGRAVLFTLDVARLHFALPVIRACRQHGLMFHLVPAKMTWLLQPCDTRVFAAYKRCFQEALVARQLESVGGQVDILGVMDAVFDAIRSVMQGTLWRGAFEEVGLRGNQASLSPAVLRQLDLASAPMVGAGPLTPEQLAAVLPRGAHLPACAQAPLPLGGAVAVESLAGAASVARADRSEDEAQEGHSRWVGRARSSSTLGGADTTIAAPPSASAVPASAPSSQTAASAWPAMRAPMVAWPPRAARLPGPRRLARAETPPLDLD